VQVLSEVKDWEWVQQQVHQVLNTSNVKRLVNNYYLLFKVTNVYGILPKIRTTSLVQNKMHGSGKTVWLSRWVYIYIWHGRLVSIWYALTVTWSSAVINGPLDIVVLSIQCQCAWALGKLYVKTIAERGIKLWKLSLVWLLSTTANGVCMILIFLEPVVLSKKYVLF